MGFGNGYSMSVDHSNEVATSVRTGARVARILGQSSQVAHVWAQQTQTFGQNSKGTFYFKGAALYSYGRHYMVGFIMPDSGAITGAAILNSTSSTPTTNGQRSDARRAVSGLVVNAPDIEDIGDILARVARNGVPYATDKAEMTRYLAKHRDALSDDAANYMGALVGLRGVSVAKLLRDAALKDAKEAKAKAERLAEHVEARSIRYADMSDKEFRQIILNHGTQYSSGPMRDMAKELKAARSLAIHAKRGPLAAKSRLATLRARVAIIDNEVANYDERREGRVSRHGLLMATATVRAWRDATPEGRALANWSTMRDLALAGDKLARSGRLAALQASGAELSRLADIGMAAITAENARLRELERERQRLAQAERVTLWLAGERVGRVDFDADCGGAALRIMGDTLETSHGASVPLAHAIKVFQFVKLVRDKGESWRRNGKTIRVGHFQVDRIDPTGDFVAGCHSINWPEIERLAKSAGLFEVAPSAEALEASHA
jgi:hypothetical protein